MRRPARAPVRLRGRPPGRAREGSCAASPERRSVRGPTSRRLRGRELPLTAALVITQGPLAGRRFELEGELVIGRQGAAVTIEDSELSRRHAVVRPVEGGFEVEDLGSLNGTFVNGSRIDDPTLLAGGDAIKVGQSVLELEAAGAPATSAGAEPAGASATVAAPVPAEAPAAEAPAPPAAEAPAPPAAEAPAPPRAPAAAATPVPARSSAPSEPFGAYAVPVAKGRRRGIASRQLGPMLGSWAVVAGTAVALAVYFADHY